MRAQGYACLTDPDGIKEWDTQNCAHCQHAIHMPASRKIEEVADFCRNCMHVICLQEACRACTPFMKKVDEMEARAYARRSYV